MYRIAALEQSIREGSAMLLCHSTYSSHNSLPSLPTAITGRTLTLHEQHEYNRLRVMISNNTSFMDTSTNAAPPPMFSSESPPVKHRRSRTLTPNSRTREGIRAFACMCLSYHHMYLRRLLESWTCPNCRSGGQMANRTPQFSPSFGFLSLSLSLTHNTE